MATQSGQVHSYINTTADKRMVTDRILLIEPKNIKTWMMLGEDIGKFNMVNRNEYVYEWLQDTYTPDTDTVTSGLGSSSTTTTFTPGTANLYQPGDLLLIEDEQVWVSAVASGIPTVTRGYAGTTKATHANGTAVTFISRARIEGDDADNSPSTEVASNSNVTQIFQRSINVARSKEMAARYGMDSLVDYQIDKYMDELMMSLNRLPYRGRRYVGTSSAARTAGGFPTFITDNVMDMSSAALQKSNIDSLFQNIFDDGGDPDLLFCGSFARRKINSFYEDSVRTERSERLGGILIDTLLDPVGGNEVQIVVDRECPSDEIHIVSSKYISFYPFDPFFYENLAKTGDAIKGQVVGEYGFICAYDKAHGTIHSFSTST